MIKMLQSNQSYQSAPFKFEIKFQGRLEMCSLVRSYKFEPPRKLITYKVIFNSQELVRKYGPSLSFQLDPDGQLVIPAWLDSEETKFFTKLVSAIKKAAYFSGTSRDFHPQ